MRGLCVALLIGVWLLQGQQPPQGGQEIRFGRVTIRYDVLVSTRRLKGDVFEVEVRGKRGVPVRVLSPEQYFTMRCMQLKATLAPDERGRLVLRTAEASAQVEFVYDRLQPLSKLNGTARRALYDDQKRTITLEGDVSLDGEDEFYRIRWRDNERIVVYLEEDLQRVEAKSKERDGIPIGSMVIEPKSPKQP
jgi:hypothetical protein